MLKLDYYCKFREKGRDIKAESVLNHVTCNEIQHTFSYEILQSPERGLRKGQDYY